MNHIILAVKRLVGYATNYWQKKTIHSTLFLKFLYLGIGLRRGDPGKTGKNIADKIKKMVFFGGGGGKREAPPRVYFSPRDSFSSSSLFLVDSHPSKQSSYYTLIQLSLSLCVLIAKRRKEGGGSM